MKREALVVLSIGAVVIGLAPIAQGQSGMPSRSRDDSVTLSGESLRTIESRTLSNDYQNFFNEGSRVAQTSEGALANGFDQSAPTYSISDQLQLVVGDTLDSTDPLNLFPRGGEPGDPQRVKLEVPLRN